MRMGTFNVVMGRLWRQLAFCLFLVSFPSWVYCAGPKSSTECSAAEQSNFPKASLTNGLLNAVLYLPDPKDGYYRGSRFDWSGVVPCLAYKGHTYFGVWFPHYDPLLHDAITGPVEEFRTADDNADANSWGYQHAKPGEPFVKLGVGVLRRTDDTPYKFAAAYPLIDGGKWTTRTTRDSVSFTHHLKGPAGFAYVYTKVLKLEKNQPVLILKHELRNTGTAPIETDVYDHDFYMIDNAVTGPDMVVRFPFTPSADPEFKNARIDGKQIAYEHELQSGESAASALTGYSAQASDYDFFIENRKTGAGVEQSGDQPISHLYFWSIRTTVCPEAYVHIQVAPGQTAHWTIRYRFYAKSSD
jgi:hypothetical protein